MSGRALLQRAAGGLKRATAPSSTLQRRGFASKHDHEAEIAEMDKWRKLTYVGVVVTSIYMVYTLGFNQEHHGEHGKPKYPYLHIRNKAFPWGPCGLFETHCEEA
eukprot:jgi/Chlat1/3772/Chrsp259S03910